MKQTEKTALEYLTIGYIVTDIEHTILVMNNAAKVLLSDTKLISTLEGVVDKLPHRLQLLDHVKYCSIEHKSCSFREVEIGDKKVRIFLSPIFEDSVLTGNLLTLEDITDKVAKERAREQFLAFLVHEFRTPLTAIKGNASLIDGQLRQDKANEPLLEMVEDVKTGSNYLLQMVNQFLDVARLEEGTIKYEFKEFDAKPLIEETVQSLQVIANDHKLVLTLDTTSEAKTLVVADPNRIKQILTNLIGNALKFTEKGGVSVAISQEDNNLVISIKDSGPGIPIDSRGNLFQKFFQASNNSHATDTAKSSGIGLYVTRLLTEGMGGKVFLASSEVGKGSTFTFTVTQSNPDRLKKLAKQLNEYDQGVVHAQVAEHNTIAVL